MVKITCFNYEITNLVLPLVTFLILFLLAICSLSRGSLQKQTFFTLSTDFHTSKTNSLSSSLFILKVSKFKFLLPNRFQHWYFLVVVFSPLIYSHFTQVAFIQGTKLNKLFIASLNLLNQFNILLIMIEKFRILIKITIRSINRGLGIKSLQLSEPESIRLTSNFCPRFKTVFF